MFQCPSCGYANVQSGKPCPSCGAALAFSDDMETVQEFFSEHGEPRTARKPVSFDAGEIFDGRYRIEQLLGRGGMGSVYRVFDTVEKQERALKILHEGATQGDGTDRFLREIEILSRIDHPSVPRVYSWGGKDTMLYFVAEYVEGRDLKTHMAMGRSWSPVEVANIVASVADALAQVHEQKIVHRDIKPQNIIVSENGEVKLLDFGVARARAPGMQTLTKTGMILGTPEYMSPEQFEGKKVEPPTDVYALGVILYQLLTGELPFSGNRMEIAIRILTENVIPPRLINNAIPVWLDQIVNKCLQRDIAKRYPSAVELVADLKKARNPGRPSMFWLKGGDGVMEDPSGAWEWDLVLSSSKERPEWEEGIGLRFSDYPYKLRRIVAPDKAMRRWTYYFTYWPNGEIIRRLIAYEPPPDA